VYSQHKKTLCIYSLADANMISLPWFYYGISRPNWLHNSGSKLKLAPSYSSDTWTEGAFTCIWHGSNPTYPFLSRSFVRKSPPTPPPHNPASFFFLTPHNPASCVGSTRALMPSPTTCSLHPWIQIQDWFVLVLWNQALSSMFTMRVMAVLWWAWWAIYEQAYLEISAMCNLKPKYFIWSWTCLAELLLVFPCCAGFRFIACS
jgi:hypothetical protein